MPRSPSLYRVAVCLVLCSFTLVAIMPAQPARAGVLLDATRYDPYLRDALRFTATPVGSGAIGAEGATVSITEFENLGLYGNTSTDLIYKARVSAEIQWNEWTQSEVTITGYDPSAYSRTWLTVHYYSCEFDQNNAQSSGTQAYSITAGEYYATASPAQLTSVRIDCNYVPMEHVKTTFAGGNITVATQSEMEVVSLAMQETTWGNIAEYKDLFKNLRAEASSVGVAQFQSPQSSYGQVDIATVRAQISGAGLGYTLRDPHDFTVQAEWKQAPSAGAPFYPSGSSFTVPISLRPRVTQMCQTVEVKYGKITIDTLSDNGFLWPCGDAGVRGITDVSTAGSFVRYVGRHAYNYFGHHAAKVVFYLFTTASLSGVRLTREDLANPQIARGDWAWDLAVTGDTEALLTFSQAATLQGWIDLFMRDLWTIAGAIIGIVLVVALVRFILKVANPAASLAARGIEKQAESD